MPKVTPNFNFNGTCGEALNLYQKAFSAKVDFVLHYCDAKPEDFPTELTAEQKRYVYHSEVYFGEQRIMMADNLTIPFHPGTALSLTVSMDSAEEVRNAYDVLKDGCQIIYPIHSTTYSSCTVSLIDKFGFRWVIMTEQAER